MQYDSSEREREVHLFLDKAEHGNWDYVEAWLWSDPSNVSRINDVPSGRWSALHQAAFWGAEEVAMMLVRFGADPTLRNREDQTPSEVAKIGGYSHLAELLGDMAACSEKPKKLGTLRVLPRQQNPDISKKSQEQTSRHSRAELLTLCKSNGWAYKDASRKFKADTEIAQAACSNSGLVLEFAPPRIQNTKDVVIAACSQDGNALQFASLKLKNDREVALVACSQNGHALQFASKKLQKDRGFVMSAVTASRKGKKNSAYNHALECHREDRDIAIAALHNCGDALEFAPWEIKDDEEAVSIACRQNGRALEYASFTLKDNKQLAMTACSNDGLALQFASPKLKSDKEVVLEACSKDGFALQYASVELRATKEIVVAAVESNPESLKFALAGLNQDKDCLIKARLWDEDYHKDQKVKGAGAQADANKKTVVLSTKFSLTADSSAHATRFTVELKKHPYIASGDFRVYSPNAFSKGTCDPQWTDKTWPCRGTFSSCQNPPYLKSGMPQAKSCWRYSFRYHLEEASYSGGFMIQVADLLDYAKEKDPILDHTLGDGQMIESKMALVVGIKVFRFFEPMPGRESSYASTVDLLVSKIKSWYDEGCSNMTECNVPIQSPLAQTMAARAARKTVNF
ncbi:unknown protein [Seminavis robusta]|uniref:DUF4116 domain-containing protein n=1 Tax=Seminavis robusta TaxID=568900 RepID=A0A9N8ECR0_9STRA|nr:unknown protein [Seminavis robusta]|eukprot:Sro899_g217740.1 n/a (630) ;mRNA; f:16444-18333